MEKFYFEFDFDGVFFEMIPHKKCNKSYSKHFFVAFLHFCIKGIKGLQIYDFAGDEKFLFFIRF